jgi:hypothetical protein
MIKLTENKGYEELINNIGSIYDKAKSNVVSAVNVEMLNAYWEIGRFIVEFEQNGSIKAKYGKELLL